MRWYEQLITGTSIAGVLFGLGLAIAAGLALGAIKGRGLSIGIAGVLFSGIAISYLAWRHAGIEHLVAAGRIDAAAGAELELARGRILEFVRALGLVLFAYAIGMEVGPGFVASLRNQGLRWNLMVVSIVAMNILVVLVVQRGLSIDPAAAVGIMSGAVTNTPGLAAAEQALRDIPGLAPGGPGRAEVGYAVAYPVGIAGTMLTLILVRAVARRWPGRPSEDAGRDAETSGPTPLGGIDLRVANPAVVGQRVGSLGRLLGAPVVISRMMRNGAVELPAPETQLNRNDVVHAVGAEADLERLAVLIGGRSSLDLPADSRRLSVRRLAVTRAGVVGQALGKLDLRKHYGVNVTRVVRAGLELVPSARIGLHYGDTIVVVGEPSGLAEVEQLVGNEVRELAHPQLVPVFLGIALGVLAGLVPLPIGGLPEPVRLGLAGGPLLVATLSSHRGRIGRINFYLPASARLMLRDLGIALFLGCVGLASGERFIETLWAGAGVRWLLVAAVVTLPALLVNAAVARLFFRLDAAELCGVLAGSMTSPPALAFAGQLVGEKAAVAYGAVYPLAMILRVVAAQFLVVLWVGGPRA